MVKEELIVLGLLGAAGVGAYVLTRPIAVMPEIPGVDVIPVDDEIISAHIIDWEVY